MGGLQNFADTAVESLYHTARVEVTRRRQSMLNIVFRAKLVEVVLVRGLAIFLREAVGEGLIIVGEQLGDDERALPGCSCGTTGRPPGTCS